jgi:hypothetical protein
MGGYTMAVSGQWLGKQVAAKQTTEQRPLLGSRFLILQQLDYTNGRTVFSMWSMSRCYKQGTKLVDSSVQQSVRTGPELEAEE